MSTFAAAMPSTRRQRVRHALALRLLTAVLGAGAFAACSRQPAALTQLVEARRLAAHLHVQFIQATESSHRAVMADTDERATAAADEARRARQAAEQNAAALQSLLESLGYREDQGYLEGFRTKFVEYRQLDDEILSLAVENTNAKAQRLSFGPASAATRAFQAAVGAALATSAAADRCRAAASEARARASVLQIAALHAPHIAEADDGVMTRLEGEMNAAVADARTALSELRAALPPAAAPRLEAADAALASLLSVHVEIITLSRRNSNVRSVALSLGRKRAVTVACEAQLQALEAALGRHAFSATR